MPTSPTAPEPILGAEPYWKIAANLAVVLASLAVVAWLGLGWPEPPEETAPPLLSWEPEPEPVAHASLSEPEPIPIPEPEPVPVPPPPAPKLDKAAIAAAEAELEAARTALKEAEARVVELKQDLDLAKSIASARAEAVKALPDRLRDPKARVARVSEDLAKVSAERDRLRRVVQDLESARPPRRALTTDQSPVARSIQGEEYHFEVRGDRVAFIDMDRLIDLVSADARLRIRFMNGSPRPFRSTVGPVGAFSMEYEMGQAGIRSLNSLLELTQVSYTITGFEIVPERPVRGETFDVAMQPVSEFAQVINRLRPGRTTITLWVYPDGFPLYRRLRELLHDRGFIVAARPLPDGIPIRGSPDGTLSAGQ